ncbi:PqqD family protein [Bacillus taeanensis]|uniref:Peptidase n=1 Tax=Bacillus taeanensis TaxID=273032 RepID=A0A366XTV4_9BACI|nr:PqqD family protein [Bacillus taeanensis]RBW68189.1 peptidase [Bacillus taeanensis]
MKITLTSKVKLVKLIIHEDNKEFIVEDPQSNDYFQMNACSIDAIRLLNSNQSLGEIEEKLSSKYPEEDIDMIAFTEQLIELKLIREIDGQAVERKKNVTRQTGFNWLPSSIGKFFFSKAMRVFYFFLFISSIGLMIYNPNLFPHYRDLFVFEHMTFNLLLWMGVSLIIVLHHELGHLLAVRSYNFPARLGISNRLFLVVFETEMNDVWKLKRSERNMPYLAGLCFDMVLLFGALFVQAAFPDAPAILHALSALIVFDIVIKVVYQCCFYMKTDLYYVIENMTGCYNLMENSKRYLQQYFPFIRAERDAASFEGEERVIRLYAFFYLVGIGLSLALFTFYMIPQMVYTYTKTLPHLTASMSSYWFWDAVIILLQSLLMIGLFVRSQLIKRKETKEEWQVSA